jgi:ubiquinone/menaquinone biosynthesis C-methylase UbiE
VNPPPLRISPAAFFSVGEDGVRVGLRGRADGLVVSPGVFSLVAGFADATPVEDALGGRDQEYAAAAREALDELVTFGVLVAEPGRSGADDGASARPPAEHHHREALGQLDDIHEVLQRIVGDLHALGPRGSIDAVSGALGRVLSDLVDVQSRVEGALEEAARREVQALAGTAGPRMLHLGAGATRLAGWTNIDIHPADVSWNLARALPFEDGSVDFIYSAHTFEHLVYPDEAHRHLRELCRVLAPDGVVRLVVPDLEALARAYTSGSAEVFAALARNITGREPAGATPLEQLLAYAGAPVRIRGRWYDHKFGYDFTTLRAMLARVGFRQVRRSSFMGSDHAELRIDELSAGGTISIAGHSMSLFVEATPGLDRPEPAETVS